MINRFAVSVDRAALLDPVLFAQPSTDRGDRPMVARTNDRSIVQARLTDSAYPSIVRIFRAMLIRC